MDAECTIDCTCEFCHPNWFLGRDDEFVVRPEPKADTDLAREHALKVRAAGLDFALEAQAT